MYVFILLFNLMYVFILLFNLKYVFILLSNLMYVFILFWGCAGSLLLRGLFITLLSLLIAAAPLAAEHRLKGTELQSLQPVGSTLAVLWL